MGILNFSIAMDPSRSDVAYTVVTVGINDILSIVAAFQLHTVIL